MQLTLTFLFPLQSGGSVKQKTLPQRSQRKSAEFAEKFLAAAATRSFVHSVTMRALVKKAKQAYIL